MAMLNGLFGSFTGSVGNYVGCRWKGGMYIRSKPTRSANYQPSAAQLAQQQRLALATGFTKTLSPLLRVSFQPDGSNKPGRNRALSRITKQAITGVYPHLSLQYSQVRISEGSLPGAADATALASGAGEVRFQWTPNGGWGTACNSDKALLVVHCPALSQSLYNTAAADRRAGMAAINATAFAGHTVHTWLGFISEDGQLVATSVYTGELVMV